MVLSIAFYAGLITAVTLAAFLWALADPGRADKAETMSFLTLSLAQLFHLGNARSADPVLGLHALTRNRYALGALALTLLLQVMALHLPALAGVLDTRPLSGEEWLVALGLGLVPAVVGQAIKVGRRGAVA
jgi:Ca2+-transporting ATPase